MDNQIRSFYFKRVAISLIIATLLFLSGFWISNAISYYRYTSTVLAQESITYNLFSLQLQQQLLKEDCTNFDYFSVSKDLISVGDFLSLIEQEYGKQNEEVLEQKKVYSMLEVQHFLMMKEHTTTCKNKFNSVLFFYSNEINAIGDSEKIGFILGNLKNNKELFVYSFDYNLNSDLISTLKGKYNITQENSVLVNEKYILLNVRSIEDIQPYLN